MKKYLKFHFLSSSTFISFMYNGQKKVSILFVGQLIEQKDIFLCVTGTKHAQMYIQFTCYICNRLLNCISHAIDSEFP